MKSLDFLTETDRRAVTDGSRGFQPTDCQTGKVVSQSDTGIASIECNPADDFLSPVPVSLCDTNGFAHFPWAEAHGYRPSPLCGENAPRSAPLRDQNTASLLASTALLC